MKQFLETICILDGIPQHLEWHQRRLDATLRQFYPAHKHSWLLKDCIEVPAAFLHGKVRCRIVYDAHLFTIHFFEYTPRTVHSLRVIEIPSDVDYRYKYADREWIEELFKLREDADDVLMTRGGWIMDTSIANIAFEKNGRWYAPAIPLLAGTTWKRLLASGKIIPTPIHCSQLNYYESYKIFNAMNDFHEGNHVPIKDIRMKDKQGV